MDSTRSALIVASDQYTDPGLRRLQAPTSDARALAAVLRDPEIGDFQVRTLVNEPAHVVSLAVEDFLADRRPGDLLLVHFPVTELKIRTASCTSPRRTPCWTDLARLRCQLNLLAGG